MQPHQIVSQEEWLVARRELLRQEKALTRENDRLAAARRDLPWVRIEKDYVFEGAQGRQSLAQLFGGNSQLIVYHFMFGPDWQQGCPSCSFLADHIDGANLHLQHHDVTVTLVSRAPWPKIEAFKRRMGWQVAWVSSHGSDFNFDFNVSFTETDKATNRSYYNFQDMPYMFDELPGISVFYKDTDSSIYHTYSTYARGGDILLGAHNYLDLTPKGRNEDRTMDWVRHHDRYESASAAQDCCAEISDPVSRARSQGLMR